VRTYIFFFGCSERFSSTVGIPRKVVGRCFEGRRPVGKPRGRWDDGVWICSGNVRGGSKGNGSSKAEEGGWGEAAVPSNGQKRRRGRKRSGV